MTNHTPGPWAVSQNNPRLVKHLSGPVLAECGPVNAEEAQANARLIAAAPELLGALTSLMTRAAHDAETYTADDSAPIWAFISDAADAIAKAKGE